MSPRVAGMTRILLGLAVLLLLSACTSDSSSGSPDGSGAEPDAQAVKAEMDAEALERDIAGLRFVAPVLGSREQVLYKAENVSAEIVGTTLSYFDFRGVRVARVTVCWRHVRTRHL